MTKKLEMDDKTALRLYHQPTASPEFKEMLEQNFGKDFFSTNIRDRIKNYDDVCERLNVSSDDSKIKIEVEGFSDDEIKITKTLIKIMRIAKVYNQGWLPKRGENRYYPYFDLSGSSFVFSTTIYGDSCAGTDSASRLCFKTREDAADAGKKFLDIYKDFIDVRR